MTDLGGLIEETASKTGIDSEELRDNVTRSLQRRWYTEFTYAEKFNRTAIGKAREATVMRFLKWASVVTAAAGGSAVGLQIVSQHPDASYTVSGAVLSVGLGVAAKYLSRFESEARGDSESALADATMHADQRQRLADHLVDMHLEQIVQSNVYSIHG